VKRNIAEARPSPDADAELGRIRVFEEELARVPVNSRRHRELTAAITVEAHAYCKSLDTEQARRFSRKAIKHDFGRRQ
jgi:hypothetical protein